MHLRWDKRSPSPARSCWALVFARADRRTVTYKGALAAMSARLLRKWMMGFDRLITAGCIPSIRMHTRALVTLVERYPAPRRPTRNPALHCVLHACWRASMRRVLCVVRMRTIRHCVRVLIASIAIARALAFQCAPDWLRRSWRIACRITATHVAVQYGPPQVRTGELWCDALPQRANPDDPHPRWKS